MVATIGSSRDRDPVRGHLPLHGPVTLISDRAGLVMDSGAKVKMRGVQVGQVGRVTGGQGPVNLELEIEPDQIDTFRPT